MFVPTDRYPDEKAQTAPIQFHALALAPPPPGRQEVENYSEIPFPLICLLLPSRPAWNARARIHTMHDKQTRNELCLPPRFHDLNGVGLFDCLAASDDCVFCTMQRHARFQHNGKVTIHMPRFHIRFFPAYSERYHKISRAPEVKGLRRFASHARCGCHPSMPRATTALANPRRANTSSICSCLKNDRIIARTCNSLQTRRPPDLPHRDIACLFRTGMQIRFTLFTAPEPSLRISHPSSNESRGTGGASI